jgi:hypothetical protein
VIARDLHLILPGRRTQFFLVLKALRYYPYKMSDRRPNPYLPSHLFPARTAEASGKAEDNQRKRPAPQQCQSIDLAGVAAFSTAVLRRQQQNEAVDDESAPHPPSKRRYVIFVVIHNSAS